MKKKFVVAFNRDRDFYQLPWALAEENRLQALVTDIYLPDALRSVGLVSRLGLAHRSCPGISSRRVRCSAKAVWLQLAHLRFARSVEARNRVFHALDATLSRIAGHAGIKANAGLFLYSGYALEAFASAGAASLRKLLFVYHPQGDFVRQILTDDFERHPEVAHSHQAHLDEISTNEGERVRKEIQMADAVVCASTFTATSVRHAMGDSCRPVRVVPYGVTVANHESLITYRRPVGSAPQVLFVGQGTQRKGLHHLLKVWSRGFDREAELTLVINKLDPGISKLIDRLPSKPRLLERLSSQQLLAEYECADIFVLPSLVEGFGLVYLEALAAGCHLIGTTNTGLPDLKPPPEAATIVQPGDSEELYAALKKCIRSAALGEFDRSFIRRFSASCTWENFRQGIRDFVDALEFPSDPGTAQNGN